LQKVLEGYFFDSHCKRLKNSTYHHFASRPGPVTSVGLLDFYGGLLLSVKQHSTLISVAVFKANQM